jgi:hypothetical protein
MLGFDLMLQTCCLYGSCDQAYWGVRFSRAVRTVHLTHPNLGQLPDWHCANVRLASCSMA